MKRIKLLVCGMVFLFTCVLCFGTPLNAIAEYKDYPVPKDCMDQVRKEGNKLFIYDWAEWWPEKLFDDFSKEYGVKVTRDHYASTDEMVTKFKLNPETPFDLVTGAGGESLTRLRRLGLLQKINHDWIPNVNAYMIDKVKNLKYDPGYQYSVCEGMYFTNYVFNKKFVDPNDPLTQSWGLLFEKNKYAGKITMTDSWMECVGAALKYLGYSWHSDNEKELMKAKELLLRQKPLLMAYDSWPKRMINDEEAYISQLWSGDGWFLHQDNKNIMSALPIEGTFLGTGLSYMPIGGKHPATAHLWLNFLYRPENYALLINAIAYTSVHKAANPLLSKEMLEWPGAQPSEEYLEKCEILDVKAITGKGLDLRMKIWKELKE